MKKIAIIGGGLLGMCLSYYLSKAGQKVVLIEKSNTLGGLASGFEINGFPLEKYYHHLFKSDSAITQLINELGLGDDLQWLKSKVGVYKDEKIFDFSTSISLLKFPKISLFNRVRGGLVSLYLQKTKDVKNFENISALEWCYKYFGKQFTDIIWKPLLLGKFGEEYFDKISMAWLWTRIHDRSSSRKGLLEYEYLGYPKKSFKSVIDALHNKLIDLDVEIKLGFEVKDHLNNGKKHQLILSDGNSDSQEEFDQVVVTTNPDFFVEKFNPSLEYKDQVKKIKYLGAVCFVFKLNKSFSPYYWLNITDPEFPFLAVVEHTNFVDEKLFKGDKILYIAKYLKTDDSLFTMPENKLFEKYVTYLQKINPAFDKSWIIDKYYFKNSFAQHIVPVGYKPLPYKTGIEGLYYANFSQIYPHDRGMNYAVVQAQDVTNLLLSE